MIYHEHSMCSKMKLITAFLVLFVAIGYNLAAMLKSHHQENRFQHRNEKFDVIKGDNQSANTNTSNNSSNNGNSTTVSREEQVSTKEPLKDSSILHRHRTVLGADHPAITEVITIHEPLELPSSSSSTKKRSGSEKKSKHLTQKSNGNNGRRVTQRTLYESHRHEDDTSDIGKLLAKYINSKHRQVSFS